jgi:MSHA pilin protein MshD
MTTTTRRFERFSLCRSDPSFSGRACAARFTQGARPARKHAAQARPLNEGRYTSTGNVVLTRPAFTIIEAVMSVAIVGILLATSLTAFAGIAKQRKVQAERREAYEIGQQLMTEILQQYFQDPVAPVWGPESGETRATFNDVDDYDGYTETNPTLKDGTALSDYTGWTRSVAVTYVDPLNPANTIASSTLKRITVKVTAPSGKQYTLVGLRSQYGPYESTPPSPTNYVTWVGVDVQAGTSTKTTRTGSRPLNVVTSQ